MKKYTLFKATSKDPSTNKYVYPLTGVDTIYHKSKPLRDTIGELTDLNNQLVDIDVIDFSVNPEDLIKDETTGYYIYTLEDSRLRTVSIAESRFDSDNIDLLIYDRVKWVVADDITTDGTINIIFRSMISSKVKGQLVVYSNYNKIELDLSIIDWTYDNGVYYYTLERPGIKEDMLSLVRINKDNIADIENSIYFCSETTEDKVTIYTNYKLNIKLSIVLINNSFTISGELSNTITNTSTTYSWSIIKNILTPFTDIYSNQIYINDNKLAVFANYNINYKMVAYADISANPLDYYKIQQMSPTYELPMLNKDVLSLEKSYSLYYYAKNIFNLSNLSKTKIYNNYKPSDSSMSYWSESNTLIHDNATVYQDHKVVWDNGDYVYILDDGETVKDKNKLRVRKFKIDGTLVASKLYEQQVGDYNTICFKNTSIIVDNNGNPFIIAYSLLDGSNDITMTHMGLYKLSSDLSINKYTIFEFSNSSMGISNQAFKSASYRKFYTMYNCTNIVNNKFFMVFNTAEGSGNNWDTLYKNFICIDLTNVNITCTYKTYNEIYQYIDPNENAIAVQDPEAFNDISAPYYDGTYVYITCADRIFKYTTDITYPSMVLNLSKVNHTYGTLYITYKPLIIASITKNYMTILAPIKVTNSYSDIADYGEIEAGNIVYCIEQYYTN